MRVLDVRSENRAWVVELQRLPPAYGGHATVRVAQDGAIISYTSGLCDSNLVTPRFPSPKMIVFERSDIGRTKIGRME